jgi:hypothetical protein
MVRGEQQVINANGVAGGFCELMPECRRVSGNVVQPSNQAKRVEGAVRRIRAWLCQWRNRLGLGKHC